MSESAGPLRVFGIVPAWGLPCVSPFVTKLAYGLRLAGVAYELRAQNPLTLEQDSPCGKLPYAVWPDGKRLADSSAILQQLAPEPGAITPRRRALSLLVQRLVDEHLYWHAVVEPRWADDAAWLRYRRLLFGATDSPQLLALSDAVRSRTLAQWRASGQGVLPAWRREARAREDVRALASLLESQGPFLLGDEPGHGDMAAASMTAHMLEAPFASPAADEARRWPALDAHLKRVRARMDPGTSN